MSLFVLGVQIVMSYINISKLTKVSQELQDIVPWWLDKTELNRELSKDKIQMAEKQRNVKHPSSFEKCKSKLLGDFVFH